MNKIDNSDPQILDLDLGARSYRIEIGDGILADAGHHIKNYIHQAPIFVITDENVLAHHWSALERSLKNAGINAKMLCISAGESSKNFNQLQAITDWLLKNGVDRKSTVIAFGGGVVGDLVGFAAAITMRGINFIQIPTTLLSQVDSSVGGKTGINSDFGKNLVGAFHQPKYVLIDVATLDTLDDRQVLSGYAEVVKYALIGDVDFFNWLEQHGLQLVKGDKGLRQQAIYKSCQHKALVVAADEHEHGVRALLNLGHTFGHAFEAETGYGNRLFHGEAVAIGTIVALDLSVRLGLCKEADLKRVTRHFKNVGLPVSLKGLVDDGWSAVGLLDHMGRDKKTESGTINFILMKSIGDAFITNDVGRDKLNAALELALKNGVDC